MKNIVKKSIGFQFCLLLLGIMFPNVSNGQNVIYDLAPIQSEYSLIRHYKDCVDITFSFYTCDEKGFYYIDRQNNITYRANLPCQFDVDDFRIFGDNVYFCGWKNEKIIIGWFDINDVFFLGGAIKIRTFPHVTTGYDWGVDGFERLRKLKVFKKNGDTHLVMVGDGLHRLNDIIGGGSIIVDAWSNNHSTWQFEYTMDYSGEMIYDDIAVTENYVVVSAQTSGSTSPSYAPALFYYSLPISSGVSIFNTLGLNYIYTPYSLTDATLLQCNHSRLLVTEMGGDYFATVCYAVIRGSTQATIVTYYQDPVIWPISRYAYIPPSYFNGSYNEICYNKRKRSLYMPKFHTDYIERFSPPFTDVEIHEVNSVFLLMSMDTLDIKGDAVISGTETGGPSTKKIWKLDEASVNTCVNTYKIAAWEEAESRTQCTKFQYVYSGNLIEDRLEPIVESFDVVIKCQQ